MHDMSISVLLAASLVSALIAGCTSKSRIPENAAPMKLAEGFSFTEGPAADAEGNVYFTDPFYPRDYWNRGPVEQDCQGVYCLFPDQKSVIRAVEDLVQPNGIAGTPDGKTLYIADIGDNRTYQYVIQPDGSLSDKVLFCSQGSDGMTLDNRGNLYLTGDGVTVYDPDGNQIAHYDVPENWTANVCFGGRDRNMLFITASQGIYGLYLPVRGVDSQAQ